MTLRLAAAYEKDCPQAEQGLPSFPRRHGVYAVHTRHPFEIALYTEDCSHPSLTGSYLAALCHFASLYGDSPLDVDYAPAGVGFGGSRPAPAGRGGSRLRPVDRDRRIPAVSAARIAFLTQTPIPDSPVRRHIRVGV